ncbi:MAG: hypothetical protein ACR2LY_02205, partial [Thermoleophilaceae bacterium]
TCQAGIDAEQISCVECGTLLARRSTLAGVAWRLPVATVGAVALVMATGIGYASGAVVQDGDVSVAEAPAPGAESGLPEASGSDGDGGGGGGADDLAQLDPPGDGDGNGNGNGDGSSLDSGDGDGNGNGNNGNGNGGGDSDDDGGGDSGGGGGSGRGDGNGRAGNGSGGGGSAPKGREFGGPEESRDLAKFPAGATGYTVALKVASSRAVAVREAQAAANEEAAGTIPAGVISRSDFPSLPGAHVAFAGRFNTRVEAERAQENYSALGFSGEVIFVGAGGG